MSTRDEAQSSRRDQRNQPSRLTRSRRLRWLGGRSRAGEPGEPSVQGGQADASPQVGASIPGIQPLEMAAADFGSLRAQHSSVRQRGSALVNQVEDVGWLYARIYCAGGDDTDALLPEIAQWLARARGQWDIRSAHFLRFVDLRGHHIRLRLKAVQGVLDDAYASMRELGAVARRAEARTVERLVSDPMTGGIGASRPGIAFGVYGPEYDKYGGVAGVEEAERHFYLSSRWCLDHQIWQIPRPVPRAALAARFLALAARSAPLPEAELLSAHLRMWGSRLPAHLRDGSALGPIVQQLLEVIEFQFDEIPSWSKAAGALGELADDAGRAIGAMGAGTDGRRALDLLHIDVNRLGLNPAEECIAGLCARQLLSGGAAPPAQPSAAAG
ncbi:bacteriocin biosynthesis protein [Actinomyces johnsonii]|uniref:Bacteriocin biosynthesis protein n=1 Tax=Actinomyces johnsonii TaxID=544581 RepID=A0A507ZX25_9ACTO|nr:thiopeptide-type bacteriocin biosynthesis protein [Actinomyces johnsonii]KAA8738375.1 bacteriocin biosynthesis protein [Actinomyces johnsonii]TQD41507.1 bacteriocin biosynthesis protein [Actinomyces johnsonii]